MQLRMDLEEWEVLSDDGFVDLREIDERSKFSSISNSNSVIDVNYFQKFIDPPKNFREIGEITQEITKLPIESTNPEKQIKAPLMEDLEFDQEEKTSQVVFFKKLKENEFVDMKMDSPKSKNRGFIPQIDVGNYQFEEDEEEKYDNFEKEKRPPMNNKEKSSENPDLKEVSWEEDDNGGLNIWKWAMTGIGALFSFGFAAATVSLIVLGNRHKETHHLKNQELHFQFYTNDKGIKQVVHHATKLNETITGVRGAPLTRAHITIGGYYEGL